MCRNGMLPTFASTYPHFFLDCNTRRLNKSLEMKKLLKLAVVLLVATCGLNSCGIVAHPSPEELAQDVGLLPYNYQELVTNRIKSSLIDPYSAIVEFTSAPERGWLARMGYGRHIGWVGTVTVNAKNRMGGYVGSVPYEYCIANGTVTYAQETLQSYLNRH